MDSEPNAGKDSTANVLALGASHSEELEPKLVPKLEPNALDASDAAAAGGGGQSDDAEDEKSAEKSGFIAQSDASGETRAGNAFGAGAGADEDDPQSKEVAVE